MIVLYIVVIIFLLISVKMFCLISLLKKGIFYLQGKLQEEIIFRPIREIPAVQNVNISAQLEQLPPDIRDLTMELQNETYEAFVLLFFFFV